MIHHSSSSIPKKITKPIFTWKKHLMTSRMWLFMMHAEQAALNSSAKASRVGPRGPTHGHFWSIVLAWPCWSILFTFHRVRTTSLHKNIASIAVQPKAMLCHSMPCLWMHPLVFQSSSSRLPFFRVPPGVLRRRSRPHTPHEWQWDPAWLGPGDRTTGDASWNAKMPQMGQNGSVCSNTRNGCFCCGSKVINDGTCYVGSSQASEGICPISRQLYQLDWSILSVYVLIVNVVKVMKVVNATGIEGMENVSTEPVGVARWSRCLHPATNVTRHLARQIWSDSWAGYLVKGKSEENPSD